MFGIYISIYLWASYVQVFVQKIKWTSSTRGKHGRFDENCVVMQKLKRRTNEISYTRANVYDYIITYLMYMQLCSQWIQHNLNGNNKKNNTSSSSSSSICFYVYYLIKNHTSARFVFSQCNLQYETKRL